jgi:hypothetical protein
LALQVGNPPNSLNTDSHSASRHQLQHQPVPGFGGPENDFVHHFQLGQDKDICNIYFILWSISIYFIKGGKIDFFLGKIVAVFEVQYHPQDIVLPFNILSKI